MQAALRQFINEVMIRTGAVAAAGFPIITCKVYAVSNVTKWPAGNKALYRHFTNGSLLLTQAADVGSSLLHALLESRDTSWAAGRGEWMACWKRVGKPLYIVHTKLKAQLHNAKSIKPAGVCVGFMLIALACIICTLWQSTFPHSRSKFEDHVDQTLSRLMLSPSFSIGHVLNRRARTTLFWSSEALRRLPIAWRLMVWSSTTHISGYICCSLTDRPARMHA